MTRIMYDAIDVNNLPVGGNLYAGYDDGNWPDANAIAARFPGNEVLRITVNPAHNFGTIGDGPPDNGTWPEWVGWVRMRRGSGADPTINTDEAMWQAGKDAFAAAGEPEPHWWIAAYLNSRPDLSKLPSIPAGAVALQCYDYGPYDISVVADYWPGVDPAPKPPAPVPVPVPQEDTMHQQLVYDAVNKQQHFVYLVGGEVFHRVYDELTKHMSSPVLLPGAQVSPVAGVAAAVMSAGTQLHVFGTFADTSHGTGAHYYLPLPVDTTKAESWGSGVI